MKDNIFEKLQRELGSSVSDDCQVVFVLTRIRKYFETLESKDMYLPLKFYCDWTLHTEIDNTDAVRDVIDEFKDFNSTGLEFPELVHFGHVLNSFLKDANLPRNWVSEPENWKRLKDIMQGIYSDTPLILKSKVKDSPKIHLEEKITLTKTDSGYEWHIYPKIIDKPPKAKWRY